jgi:hypothetical protein
MATRLNLEDMHERHRALTPSIAGGYQEAAGVCLSRHHTPPAQVALEDNGAESIAELTWSVPNTRILHAWANKTDTTEAGAYGCVIAGVEELRGLVAVRRADTGTGADYYVGFPGAGLADLEDCIRLEVSGVDTGDYRKVEQRLLEKISQAREGNCSLPAMAGVMGFSSKILVIRDVQEMS